MTQPQSRSPYSPRVDEPRAWPGALRRRRNRSAARSRRAARRGAGRRRTRGERRWASSRTWWRRASNQSLERRPSAFLTLPSVTPNPDRLWPWWRVMPRVQSRFARRLRTRSALLLTPARVLPIDRAASRPPSSRRFSIRARGRAGLVRALRRSAPPRSHGTRSHGPAGAVPASAGSGAERGARAGPLVPRPGSDRAAAAALPGRGRCLAGSRATRAACSASGRSRRRARRRTARRARSGAAARRWGRAARARAERGAEGHEMCSRPRLARDESCVLGER